MSKATKVTGMREFTAFLRRFPVTMQRKVLRTALSKAANPVVKQTRREARRVARNPLTPGYKRTSGKHLYSSVGRRAKTYAKAGVVFVAAGFMNKKVGNRGLWVEEGHKTKTGGMTRKRPMLKPAWEQNKRRCLGIVVREGKKKTEIEAVKLAKKTGLKKLGLK